ncbi:FAD-binding oxidoreductase [Temperatibacter marinus]|uniref:FAD-binding oxidoreductase n=1 Tax=Temperatibacter marinus TaxID=1456591 RepID=A0AA52EH22_9PROT|nr:FAD-binding oxidoreductase [Temperatibacter marinus]WND01931.1 FAD-binding oxidoreductase [Temperatibacter marinus]
MTIKTEHLRDFKALLPENQWTEDQNIIAPHLSEWRDKFHGSTPLMLMPMSTADVQKILILANKAEVNLSIQGGNTGLVGGSTPGLENREEILVSLKKMSRVEAPCSDTMTITVEAGAILSTVHTEAEPYHFPLSLASEGSCTIGGTMATNAGGIHVIRYGTMRHLVAGIEAVLPDGTIFSNLGGLKKDNTGFDLQNLLIGSEGTLGIITKAKLKLFPKPNTLVTGWLSVHDIDKCLPLMNALQTLSNQGLHAFEVMGKTGLDFVEKHMAGKAPVSQLAPWSILFDIEIEGPDSLEKALAECLDSGAITDAVIAQNKAQQKALWALRENLSEAQKYEGGSIKHDISLPLEQLASFMKQAPHRIQSIVKGARPTPFGHFGDGNLHYNIMQPETMAKETFLNHWPEMNAAIHDLVCSMKGSISAEHGIGTLKREELALRHPEKVAAFKKIKAALDPKDILNKGRVI